MDFDVIVVGAGPGGYSAAVKAAQNGKSVAVFDEGELGGTCLNRGCIPTKSLLHSSENQSIKGSGAELASMFEQCFLTVNQLRDGIANLFKRNKINYFNEHAIVSGPNTITAGGRDYSCDFIIIACGTSPSIPDIPGARENAVTSDEVLTGKADFTESVTIVGGGVIGCELANFYLNVGTKVTIIEMADRILPLIDRELSVGASALLKKLGCEIITGAKTTSISKTNNAVITEIIKDGNITQFESQGVIIATGRRPMGDMLFSHSFTECSRGYIVTDCNHKTSVDSIYAVGDIEAGAPQLAHYAEAAGRNTADIICGITPHIKTGLIPSCVYLTQELASVGLTVDDAASNGVSVYSKKSLALSNAKALIELPERGFCKLVFESESNILVGAQLFCPHASEYVGLLACLINLKSTEADLASTVFPHPTVSELISSALH